MNSIDPIDAQARPGMAGGSIGAILVDAGRLTVEQAETVLRMQRKEGTRFGDAALRLGFVGEDDIRFALARQFDYPCLPAGDSSLSPELVAAYKPFLPAVEHLRALRSQLMLRWFDSEAGRQSLAIVSAGEGDGRSFIAANLAVVFSQLGERTLLIDADLRRPRQKELFRLPGGAGLSEMLAGRAGEEAIVRIPSLLGLSVLPAGAVPPNPQELLGRAGFVELLQQLSGKFDVILVDTPAANDCADAQTIAARAGGAVAVARGNHSTTSDLARLVRTLQQSGTALVGSVFNDA